MISIRKHQHSTGYQQISIKPIENLYPDRIFFIAIIKNLMKLTKGCLILEVSRPNYESKDLIESLKKSKGYLKSDSISKSELSIYFQIPQLEEEVIDLLPSVWFAYEHVGFQFFCKSEVTIPMRQAWYDLVAQYECFIMFRGVEEDVAWIGKSNQLEFPEIVY